MSRSLNKVMLIGNVGSDPEIRTTSGGTRLAKVSLATSRTFKDRNDQQQEKTEWHRLTFWGKLAEIVEKYVNKGDKLYVEGSIEYSQSDDGNGGTKYWTDIVVKDMNMLGGGRGGNGGGSRPAAQPAAAGATAGGGALDEDDDLPF